MKQLEQFFVPEKNITHFSTDNSLCYPRIIHTMAEIQKNSQYATKATELHLKPLSACAKDLTKLKQTHCF